MTLTVGTVLVLLALICFFLAAIGVSVPTRDGNTPSRVNLIAAGLFLWLLSTLIT